MQVSNKTGNCANHTFINIDITGEPMSLLIRSHPIVNTQDDYKLQELRADCNSVFADKFEAYGNKLTSFSSGGLCSLLIRCGQRSLNKVKSTMNCNDTSNAGSNAPTLTTLRKRQRQDGALWSGSISPNGKHIACVSPFKKGFWILTITPASSANNSTAPSSSSISN